MRKENQVRFEEWRVEAVMIRYIFESFCEVQLTALFSRSIWRSPGDVLPQDAGTKSRRSVEKSVCGDPSKYEVPSTIG